MTRTTDAVGTVTYTVDYTFDATPTAVAAPSSFHLYLPDGTRLDGSTCAQRTGADAATVRCTSFVVGATPATTTQLAAVTFGTVEPGAVTSGAASSPEGSRAPVVTSG